MNKAIEAQKFLVKFIEQNFSPDRVICLITYGSSLSDSQHSPGDYDFQLVLKDYNKLDYEKAREAMVGTSIELFIDYWDQVQMKGFDNYQRGRHGAYFFKCLANGVCLVNENIYAKNLDKVSQKSIDSSLLFRIEEYFYRIQKAYINDPTYSISQKIIKKYLSRICLDLLLYTKEIPFSEVNLIHYLDVIDRKIDSSKVFNNEMNYLLKHFSATADLRLIPDIIGELYSVYLTCFEDFRRRYQHI